MPWRGARKRRRGGGGGARAWRDVASEREAPAGIDRPPPTRLTDRPAPAGRVGAGRPLPTWALLDFLGRGAYGGGGCVGRAAGMVVAVSRRDDDEQRDRRSGLGRAARCELAATAISLLPWRPRSNQQESEDGSDEWRALRSVRGGGH